MKRYYPSKGKTPWWMHLDPMRRETDMGIPNVVFWVLAPIILATSPLWAPFWLAERARNSRQLRLYGHICSDWCRHEQGSRPAVGSFSTPVQHDTDNGPCACGAWHELDESTDSGPRD